MFSRSSASGLGNCISWIMIDIFCIRDYQNHKVGLYFLITMGAEKNVVAC